MVDSVTLLQHDLDTSGVGGRLQRPRRSHPVTFEDAKPVALEHNGSMIIGSLRGLRICCAAHMLKIHGSLAKFAFGNNFQTHTRHSLAQALEEISDLLGIDIETMAVLNMEIGSNLVMKHPPEAYFPVLEELSRCTRSEMSKNRGAGIYFHNDRWELCLYDKTREARRRRNRPPDEWRGRNVLRCEKRYKSDIPKQFGTTVTARMLAGPEFFRRNVLDWRGTIQAIEHTRIVTLSDAYANATPKQVKDAMAAAYIAESGGIHSVLETIRDARQTDRAHVRRSYEIERMLHNLNEPALYNRDDDRMTEILDRANEIVRFQLDNI